MRRVRCYMCNRPSTSKEHVPPRCLFPELKDVGENHRRNLITVPSCDWHNSFKSTDDSFLMVSLAGIFGNNSTGLRHKFSKVNRAIYRSSFTMLKEAVRDGKWHFLEVGPNQYVDVIWGKPDHERLNRCFDRIARGLYYARHERRFEGLTRTHLGYLTPGSSNASSFQRFLRDKVKPELDGKERLGDNPEVFSFQFTEPDQFGIFGVDMRFYGGLDVFVAMIPKGKRLPDNLAMMLIDKGIPTTITLGDKEYDFNFDNAKQLKDSLRESTGEI
jgi:hypothetical protein